MKNNLKYSLVTLASLVKVWVKETLCELVEHMLNNKLDLKKTQVLSKGLCSQITAINK